MFNFNKSTTKCLEYRIKEKLIFCFCIQEELTFRMIYELASRTSRSSVPTIIKQSNGE
jgi:hypothetical protein